MRHNLPAVIKLKVNAPPLRVACPHSIPDRGMAEGDAEGVTRWFAAPQEARPNFLDRKTGEDSEGEDSDDSAAAEPRIVMDLACGVFDLKVTQQFLEDAQE